MRLRKWRLANGWTIELTRREGFYNRLLIWDTSGKVRFERRYAYFETERAEEEAELLAWLAQPGIGMEKAA